MAPPSHLAMLLLLAFDSKQEKPESNLPEPNLKVSLIIEDELVAETVADIGIFGGSGFYSLLEKAQERLVETPYGSPSDAVVIGTLGGKRVAFLPRHGSKHLYPPHMI